MAGGPASRRLCPDVAQLAVGGAEKILRKEIYIKAHNDLLAQLKAEL